MNANSIKKAVRDQFKDVSIVEVKKHRFGIFTVKVKKKLKTKYKYGLVFGNYTGKYSVEKKIDWI